MRRSSACRRDEVMAVGDNFNDLEMLEFAGLPVVMGNAVSGLKTRGWHVTGHHNDGGVAAAIDRFGRMPEIFDFGSLICESLTISIGDW